MIRDEVFISKRDLHLQDHCRTIHNSQNIESPQVPYNKCMGKGNAVRYIIEYYSGVGKMGWLEVC